MQDHDTLTAAAHNTRLVGFHDLQGRESLQVALQGDWCYVGHLPGRLPNPLTGQDEDSGTSILDVSDPAKPTLITHIPGAPGANCATELAPQAAGGSGSAPGLPPVTVSGLSNGTHFFMCLIHPWMTAEVTVGGDD